MSRLLTGWVILAVTAASLTVPTYEAAAVDEIAGSPTSRSDFNGDGYADLAVGSEYGEAVSVIYGSAAGLRTTGNQVWSQDSPGILGVGANDEGFGSALAAGDFDGDGFGDLAVGVPHDQKNGGGAVNVLYGSAAGLTAAGNQLWHQNSPGVAGTAETGDLFGSVLAAADVGDSAHDDLLVGTPNESVGRIWGAGAIQVLYGSPDGLTATGNRLWTQHSPGIASRAEIKDGFGASIAIGDVDADGYADAAVGSPGESVGSDSELGSEAGVIHVLYGSAAGLSSSRSQLWSQDSAGVPGTAEFNDTFGSALTFADFNGDDHDDLAVGVPFERVGSRAGGAVNVIYGSASGLSAAGSQFWSQNSPGIIGSAEDSDSFGASLAAADLGNGAPADLVVGSPTEELRGGGDGAINVLYGSPRGLSSARNQFWSSASPGIKGTPVDSGEFGASLAVGTFHGHASAELAVGAPGEADSETVGALHVITSSTTGLTADGDQLFTPNSLHADVGPYFAATLAASP